MQLPPVITIDGPSGSGKSTLSKAISKKLKWFYLESGMIYRILACLFLKNKSILSISSLCFILNNLENYFVYDNGKIHKIHNKNFSDQYIYSHQVTNIASKLAKIAYVRKKLLFKQRLFRQHPGLIADGRDMGTIVFPDARIKFFLKVKLQYRVYRRIKDLKKNGIHVNFTELYHQMKERDNRDINRKHAPLKPDKNAIILDTSKMQFIEVMKYAMSYINNININ